MRKESVLIDILRHHHSTSSSSVYRRQPLSNYIITGGNQVTESSEVVH